MAKIKPIAGAAAVAYCRVSTDKQENSLDAQQHKLAAMAQVKGFTLIETVVDEDAFSGNLKRPGVAKVMEMVKAGKVSAVIVTKLDRMTRSTRDVITLIEFFAKHKVAFISVAEDLNTETPIGRFFVRMLASLAELERETIGQRTSDGLQNLKRQKMPAGHAPFGWTSQGAKRQLVANQTEQEILRLIRDYRTSGMSLDSIAEQLNSMGFKTRKGGPWKLQYVDRFLKNMNALLAKEE